LISIACEFHLHIHVNISSFLTNSSQQYIEGLYIFNQFTTQHNVKAQFC